MFLYFRAQEEIIEVVESFSFGREVGDFTFPDDDVMSTRHGKFIVEGNKTFLMDTGSTNGTLLNNCELNANEKTALNDFDEINFGEQDIFFLLKEPKNIEEAEELIKKNKAKQLLGKVKEGKVRKVNEIKESIEKLKNEHSKYRQELLKIKEKFDKEETEFKKVSAELKKSEDLARDITENLTVHQQKFEKEKSPLYTRQTDFMDKLQLLKTAGSPESDLIPIEKELSTIKDALEVIEQKKLGLPAKAKEHNELASKLRALKNEKHKICIEIKTHFENKSKEYGPRMQEIKEQIEASLKSLERAQKTTQDA